ncbi:MAG: N-acetylmuramoyl-L-alanine amidase [Bacteroidetes bacterium]|nr:MAG: N-acetylmuramoyl-L-alanine amidase [Bacteroidota bacterium]MBL1144717.1 N-acetylmuramoyl-L-alanine amidase [Bacteroidota bacterium]NOG57511.1 N-acetylmuramoyl-L-alanine amidase [Bacteroidota bacterium]
MNKKAFLLFLFITYFIPNTIWAQNDEDFFGELNTVVIDAGHGGGDNGCSGAHSFEKDIALSIALKLGAYLEEKFDHLNVIYTRKTDVFLELDERAKIANRNKADLFICIHANAASPSAFGTETFVMGNAKSESNMRAAQRENAVILMEDNYEERYENFDPNSPESYIALTIMQSAFQNQSISFAEKVQSQFRERVGRKDRGVKMAPFLVLHQTTMPSVLIETGFLTNKAEETFLRSEIGQDYMASAIYRAFKEYKEELESISKLIVEDEKNKLMSDSKPAVKKGKDENSTTLKGEDEKSSAKMNDKEGLIFKVQLSTTTNKIDPSPTNFKGLSGVTYYEAGGLYRYTYGNEKSWESANKLQEKVRANGFEDAFIIAFNNGKRIAVGEAVKLLKH